MPVQIQHRRGTAALWTSTNPTLAAGEIGVETDTLQLKVGDGTTAWASLDYYAPDATVADGSITSAKIADATIVAGDLADGAVTSAKILDGTIVNADVNASAAIALSKLATDPLARANHTGTQTASTVSDFDTQVAATAVKKAGGGRETLSTVAASGATETLDLTSGNVHDVTLDASCTLTFTGSAASAACSFTLLLRQGGSGSYTVTWPASVDWPGGTAPTLSTTVGRVDVFTFLTVDNGTTWLGFTAGIGVR